MIFGWKKTNPKLRPEGADTVFRLPVPRLGEENGLIRFEHVSLPPSIQNLSLEIPLGSWVVLYGDDDFAKALFCDLCFSYILPESGKVHPVLRGGDVSFLGRSNTTYGRSLVDHLSCGVKETSKELLQYAVKNVLTDRFRRHLSKNLLEFANGENIDKVDLDDRDFLEIAEANLLLQNRRAAVIDTTSDFYQVALEQGFRHSQDLLSSGKTLIWIVDEENPPAPDASPWLEGERYGVKVANLSFPTGSRAGYLN